MITDAKTAIDSLIKNMDNSFKTYESNLSNKSTSQLYKVEADKSENFQKVLNLKTDHKNHETTEKVDNVNKNDTIIKETENKGAETANTIENDKNIRGTADTKDAENISKLKEKLGELEEKSKSASKDEIGDILSELAALLLQFGIKEDLKVDGKINPEILKNITDVINNVKSVNNNLSNIMEDIMKLLKNDSIKDKLDTDTLKVMEKVLSNITSNLVEDNSEEVKGIKSNIKNLMSEISNIINEKQGKGEKVLTLEDILNKNYSQSNSDSEAEKENSNTSASKDSKIDSKEDKFLKALADDDNKDSTLNKINLFASRGAVIQNQGVNATARGLSVNKATFVEDFIKDVKFMSNNGLKELTVKVNPGNLGEITIKLIQEDNVLKANLKASSKETTALLSQNLAEIKKQLSEQNIKVSDVNIELYQDDTTFFKEQGFGSQLAGEQNRENTSSAHNVSNTQSVSDDSLDDNLAEENNSVNFFA